MKYFPQNPFPVLLAALAILAGSAKAQDVQPTPDDTIPHSTGDAALTVLDGKIDQLNEEILRLSEVKSDASLEYNHMERTYLEDLLRDEADAAQKAGDAPKFAAILKEIKALDDQRDSEWAQDLVLLDKRSQLLQLKYDRLLEFYQKLEDKIKETGNEERLKAAQEAQDYVRQLKDVENQDLDLQKQLLLARQKYDYKTADDIRARMKDLRAKTKASRQKAADELKRIEGTREMDEQNL